MTDFLALFNVLRFSPPFFTYACYYPQLIAGRFTAGIDVILDKPLHSYGDSLVLIISKNIDILNRIEE